MGTSSSAGTNSQLPVMSSSSAAEPVPAATEDLLSLMPAVPEFGGADSTSQLGGADGTSQRRQRSAPRSILRGSSSSGYRQFRLSSASGPSGELIARTLVTGGAAGGIALDAATGADSGDAASCPAPDTAAALDEAAGDVATDAPSSYICETDM